MMKLNTSSESCRQIGRTTLYFAPARARISYESRSGGETYVTPAARSEEHWIVLSADRRPLGVLSYCDLERNPWSVRRFTHTMADGSHRARPLLITAKRPEDAIIRQGWAA